MREKLETEAVLVQTVTGNSEEEVARAVSGRMQTLADARRADGRRKTAALWVGGELIMVGMREGAIGERGEDAVLVKEEEEEEE